MHTRSLLRAHAFTLIELLVVIAIIAILVSILLPSLAAARNEARAVACASKARSVAQGVAAYNTGNKEFYPPSYVYGADQECVPPDPTKRSWRTGLSPYDWVAASDGAHTHRVAGVGHIPDFMCGIGVAAKHVDFVVMDRQCVAVAHADHLGAAALTIGHWNMEEVLRVPRITHIND